MRTRRPRPGAVLGQLTLVLVLPILINIATGRLPAFLEPYLWLAWPAAVASAAWIVVAALRRPEGRAVAMTTETGTGETGSTWNVPGTTRAFITRQAVVNGLDRVLAGRSPRAALLGMPGVGKSEAAAAYATANRDAFEIGWWILADTRLAVVVALATLADRLGVGGDDQESAARRVLDLLGDRADVLLVYDNADAPEELAGLLPTGRCRVVLTSRNPGVARVAEPIAVKPFTPAQAARFLRLRTGDDDKAAAHRLADSTGCLPLALEQIAGYCAASDIGLAAYADRYRTGRRRLLRAHAPDGRASIEVTISLALADIRRRSAAGAQLVRLASYLGHIEGVPRELLAAVGRGSPPELAAVAADPIELDHAIAAVRRTSLIAGGGGHLRMHPLLGDIIRDRIRHASRWRRFVRTAVALIPPRDRSAGWSEERWIDVAAATIAAALPPDSDDAATWPRWAALLPHALACLDHAKAADIRTVGIGFISNEAGLYLRRRGQYTDAQELFRLAVSNYARSTGLTHPETLHAMNNLAESFLDHGRVADAVAMHEDTYRTRVTLLGPHHSDTLASANNLAEALRLTGDLDRARALFHEVLTGTDDDLERATATNNLATVAQDLGDLDQARELYRSALRVQTKMLGDDHPDSLTTRANLADLLRTEGRLAEAHEEHARVLRVRNDVLGTEHPSTLLSAVNVALVLRELGRVAEAEALHRDAVDRLTHVLGEDHPLSTVARELA